MQYLINGNNLKTIFGVDVVNSVPPFFAYPDAKQKLQHDFPEENGIDIDLSSPSFSARTFTFNCVLSADTITNLKNKYFALFTLIKVAGTYSIYCDYVDMSVYVYFQKQASLTAPYKNHLNGLSVRFDLIFGETDPFVNIPNIFLVDDQNRFLVP